MPSKKKKYNARFPAGRIKKIMQTDEEVGKVAQAVPVIISRTLELFVESLLTKSMQITQARNAKTLTPSHMKQCILSESRFDFLKDLVKNIPDASVQEDNENNAIFDATITHQQQEEDAEMEEDSKSGPSTPAHFANFYNEQSSSSTRTPVIQYGPKVTQPDPKLSFTVNNINQDSDEPKLHITIASDVSSTPISTDKPAKVANCDNVPPLIPIAHNLYNSNVSDTLCIDEDYDN